MSSTASTPSSSPAAPARTVSAAGDGHGLLDIKSLIVLALLLAAALILNMTVGNALASTGIKPQFIVAAYTLTVLLTRANVPQAALYGLISAAVVQLSTSIPGLNLVTEPIAAAAMALLIRAGLKVGGRDVTPLVATFCATLVSGALFATLGTLVMGAALPTALAKVPTVLGMSVFNAVFVQAVYLPMRAVFRK